MPDANPFADLIPKAPPSSAPSGVPDANPFAHLIPKSPPPSANPFAHLVPEKNREGFLARTGRYETETLKGIGQDVAGAFKGFTPDNPSDSTARQVIERIGQYGAPVMAPINAAMSPLSSTASAAVEPATSKLLPKDASQAQKDAMAQAVGGTVANVGTMLAPGVRPARIAEAAKKTPAGEVLVGDKHPDIPGPGEKGFVDEKGNFKTRAQADTAAKADKQLVAPELTPGKLHSEDIGQPQPTVAPKEPKPTYQSKIFSPDQPVASTQSPGTPAGVADLAHQHEQSAYADLAEARKFLKGVDPAVTPELRAKFQKYEDNPKANPLTPQEKTLYEASSGAVKKEVDIERAKLQKAGIDPAQLDGAEERLGGAVRQRVGMGTPMDKILGGGTPAGIRSASRAADTAKARTFMNLDLGGERTPVYIDADGQLFRAESKGEPIGHYDEKDETVTLKGGTRTKLDDSTIEEIEKATGGEVNYHKDSLLVNLTTLLQLRRANRSVAMSDAIKASPEFKEIARGSFAKGETPHEVINGKKVYWREVPGIPGLGGYKLAPKYAEELEDFAHGMKAGMGELELLDRLNRFELNLFFLGTPFHALNLSEAFLVTKGLGIVKDLPGAARDFGEATKDVVMRRKPYMQYARSGVPLPGIRSAAENFNKTALDLMGVAARRHPLEFAKIAKEMLGDTASGGNPIAELFRVASNASRKGINASQDILQITLQKGLERQGMSRAKATEQIGETFMRNRAPARILNSRLMGQIVQSQAFLDFPKYFYERFKGINNMVKNLKGEERTRALSQLLMLATTYSAGRYFITPWIQNWTGNKDAKLPDFGYGAIPGLIQDAAEGKRTPGQMFQSIASPGYAVQAYDLARGVNPYSNKPISLPGETVGETAKDYGSAMLEKLPPWQRYKEAQWKGLTSKEEILQQLAGVRYPVDYVNSKTNQGNLAVRRKYGTDMDTLLQDVAP